MSADVAVVAMALHNAGVRCSPNVVHCRSTHRGHAARVLAALNGTGMSTISTARLVNLTNALLHLAARRHEHSGGCDGCLNIQAVLKELVGLPEPEPVP